jgi:hypothetical protein
MIISELYDRPTSWAGLLQCPADNSWKLKWPTLEYSIKPNKYSSVQSVK